MLKFYHFVESCRTGGITVVERRSFAGELSLFYARSAADK